LNEPSPNISRPPDRSVIFLLAKNGKFHFFADRRSKALKLVSLNSESDGVRTLRLLGDVSPPLENQAKLSGS